MSTDFNDEVLELRSNDEVLELRSNDEVLELRSNDNTFEFAQSSVFGFRNWTLSHKWLIGYYATWWNTPEMTAYCRRYEHNGSLEAKDLVPQDLVPQDLVPLSWCTCGIYAYWSAIGNAPVGGVIEGSGRTIIGSKGFRTQHARIKALCLDREFYCCHSCRSMAKQDYRSLKKIAKRFGVPFYESIKDMIAEHPLTTDYLPADPGQYSSSTAGTQ